MDGTARHRPRRRIAVVILSILLYVATLSVGFFHGFADSLQTWQGFYTLVLPNTVSLSDIHESLESAAIDGVLSAQSVTIDLGLYNGETHRVSLAQARSLLPEDPRRTPWIDSIPSFFHDGDQRYHVLYIPQHETIATLMLKLDTALSPLASDWHLVEWKPRDRITVFILLAGVALVVVIMAKGQRLAVLAASIPWIMVAAGFGPRLFPFFALALLHFVLVTEKLLQALNRFVHEAEPRHYFWELIHRPRRAIHAIKSMVPYLRGTRFIGSFLLYIVAVLILVLAALLSGDSEGIGGMLLLFVASWPGVWIWATYSYTRQLASIEHRLFFPVPILGKLRPPSRRVMRTVLPLGVSALLIPLVFLFLSSPGIGVSVPVPDGTRGSSGQNLVSLKQDFDLRPQINGEALPDLALATQHRLQQEFLAWQKIAERSSGRFPAPGTSYELTSATGASTGRMTIDMAWFETWRQKVPPVSVEHMLLVQGTAHGLAYSSKHRVYSADFWSLVGLAAFGLSCVPLFLPLGSGGRAQRARRPILWGKKTPA